MDYVQVGGGGGGGRDPRWAMELQIAHLPLSLIPVPSTPPPPRQSLLARGRGPFSGMLTRPHSWPSGAMNSVLSTSSRGLYSLLRGGGGEGDSGGEGLARPSLMCFLNSALILVRGLGVVPSASNRG